MRRITLLLPLLILGPAACTVSVSGAPCHTTANCPWGEVCEAGTCRPAIGDEEGNCECLPGESQRCADNGSRVTCVADDACPYYPESSETFCAAPWTCVQDGNTTACACAPLGAGKDQGCETPGAMSCSGDAILKCEAVGECLLWVEQQNCADTGLVCGTPTENDPPQCVCPANTTTTFYVDPAKGSSPSQGVRATGIQSPAMCRFERLTDAVVPAGKAPQSGTVVLTGAVEHERWEGRSGFKNGEVVVPSPRNGWLYRAQRDGKTDDTQPVWPGSKGGTVKDNEITWENVGPDTLLLEKETFPLEIPGQVKVTTSDCLADRCEYLKYALAFGQANGGGTASSAVRLSADVSISGLAILDAGGNPTASAVECASGTAMLDHVWLQGSATQAPRLAVGVSATGSCNLTVKESVIGLFSSAGLTSLSSGSLSLEAVALGAGWGRTLPLGAGLLLLDGTTVATGLGVFHASQQGIAVEGASTEVTLTLSEVSDNGRDPLTPVPGITVEDGKLHLFGTRVDRNGLAGLHVRGGAVSVASFEGAPSTFNDNRETGVRVSGGELSAHSLQATGNRTHGMDLGAAKVALVSPTIASNVEFGIFVNGAGDLKVTGGEIKDNARDNVHVTGASSTAYAEFDGVTLQGSDSGAGMMLHAGLIKLMATSIGQNQTAGIEGSLSGSGPTVEITSSTIWANEGTGINAQRGSWTINRSTVRGNGLTQGVGMEVGDAASLPTFAENKLYANQRAQLRFVGRGLGSVLDPKEVPGTCASSSANEISCYPAGAVGIEALKNAQVHARSVWFKNANPVQNVDYTGSVTTYCTTPASPALCAP